jgi:type II secretory pathway pseudopilin PulG
MTLVEVMTAMLIATIVFAGVIAGLVQSRRLTEGSLAQSNAQAAVESYMEQMTNTVSLANLINSTSTDVAGNPQNPNPSLTSYSIPTQSSDASFGNDPLWTSTGTPPDLQQIKQTPGVTSFANCVDNLKEVPANPNNPGATIAWGTLWPGTNTTVSKVHVPLDTLGNVVPPKINNLHLNLWVWVQNISDTSSSFTPRNVYSITIIYTWQFFSGLGKQYYVGSLRTVRSTVKTY